MDGTWCPKTLFIEELRALGIPDDQISEVPPDKLNASGRTFEFHIRPSATLFLPAKSPRPPLQLEFMVSLPVALAPSLKTMIAVYSALHRVVYATGRLSNHSLNNNQVTWYLLDGPQYRENFRLGYPVVDCVRLTFPDYKPSRSSSSNGAYPMISPLLS